MATNHRYRLEDFERELRELRRDESRMNVETPCSSVSVADDDEETLSRRVNDLLEQYSDESLASFVSPPNVEESLYAYARRNNGRLSSNASMDRLLKMMLVAQTTHVGRITVFGISRDFERYIVDVLETKCNDDSEKRSDEENEQMFREDKELLESIERLDKLLRMYVVGASSPFFKYFMEY